MEESEFSVGDVVRLKSGDQLMTVGEVGVQSGRSYVFCVWIASSGTKESEYYQPEMLIKVNAPTS